MVVLPGSQPMTILVIVVLLGPGEQQLSHLNDHMPLARTLAQCRALLLQRASQAQDVSPNLLPAVEIRGSTAKNAAGIVGLLISIGRVAEWTALLGENAKAWSEPSRLSSYARTPLLLMLETALQAVAQLAMSVECSLKTRSLHH